MTSPFADTTIDHAPTQGVRIWMAGNYDQARQIIREFCSEQGACFSITKTDYIYSGGEEAGFCVTSINYPRFPSTHTRMTATASDLALRLMKGLNQSSFTLEEYGFEGSTSSFYSRRKSD